MKVKSLPVYKLFALHRSFTINEIEKLRMMTWLR